MSILAKSADGWILSHAKYFENVQVCTESDEEDISILNPSAKRCRQYKLDPRLFEIVNPFIVEKPNMRLSDKNLTETTSRIEKQFKQLLKVGEEKNVFTSSNRTIKTKEENNRIARLRANDFYEQIQDLNFITNEIKLFGRNTEDYSVTSKVQGHSFIFQPNTAFHCRNVDEMERHLKDEAFDLIVLDPPWRNKYIRRRKRKHSEAGYELLNACDIGSIPIAKISHSNSLVVVWCTNAKAHQDELINQIFPKWSVEYLTTWYWVKVTKNGEPIVPFNSNNKKQPYEAIILGRRISEQPLKNHDDLKCLKVLISIPSSIHSHKPPLIEILKTYLSSGSGSYSNNCEIFARYLVPGFTSFGNEVIKLQHASLFVQCEAE